MSDRNRPARSAPEELSGRPTRSLTLKSGGVMSDGREEREERALRIEREKREDREDRIHRGDVDEWEPERVDT
jgi:hypothetical protein